MKKKLVFLLLITVLLTPWNIMHVDDGGTVVYSAPLYRVTKRHSMWWEEDVFGHLVGKEIEILSFNVYEDVRFIPALPYSHAEDWSEEAVSRQLQGCTRRELIQEWGEPTAELSGFYGDRWQISDATSVVVYYSDASTVQSVVLNHVREDVA